MRVSVLGPGLLGGSILKALRKRKPEAHLKVWARRPDAAYRAAQMGLADEVCESPSQAAREATHLILCTTIDAMPAIAQAMVRDVRGDCMVTDVGSVKGWVDEQVGGVLREKCLWIGSHPMAGSERTGIESAREDLFEGATTILTPVPSTNPEAIEKAGAFWKLLGCTIKMCAPDTHDQRVAEISHLPHLLAALVVESVSDEALEFRGSGFMDTTRIAAGSPTMWADILLENRQAVAAALRIFQERATSVLPWIEEANRAELEQLLTNACNRRKKLSVKEPDP